MNSGTPQLAAFACPGVNAVCTACSAVQTTELAVQTGLPLCAHIEGVLPIAGTQAPNSLWVLHEFRLGAARSVV